MAHKYPINANDDIGGIGIGNETRGLFMPARKKINGSVAPDSVTLSLANFPVANALACANFETVWLRANFTGGGSIVLMPLILDPEDQVWLPFLNTDNSRYTTPPLTSDNGMFEIRVASAQRVFFRIHGVNGTVAGLELRVIPGTRIVT